MKTRASLLAYAGIVAGCTSGHCAKLQRVCDQARYEAELVDPDGVVQKAKLCTRAAARFADANGLPFPITSTVDASGRAL